MKLKIIILSLSVFIILCLAIATVVSFEYSVGRIKSKIVASSVEEIHGNAPENTSPVILLHGLHLSYNQRISEYTFKEMQSDLSKDLNYTSKGILNPDTTCAELQYSDNPIIVRTTYLQSFGLVELDAYSENLDKIINKVKECTGAEKVDLVTHSMGGVVARHYIKNNPDAPIGKLIMIGTPNNGGLYGVAEIADFLNVEGESMMNLDFISLSEKNNLMMELNKNSLNDKIEYYTIAGNIDGKGDGIVEESSVKLKNSKHTTVNCNHIQLKDPSRCPEAYETVKQILKNPNP